MDKSRLLKLLGGLGIGAGTGLCFGVSMDNILLGLWMGLGVGLCFAVAFGAFGGPDKKS